MSAYLETLERVLKRLPEPPDPEDDDIALEELEEAFDVAAQKAFAKVARPAPRPKPRKDVPPPPPPPDFTAPKTLWAIRSVVPIPRKNWDAYGALMFGAGIGKTSYRGCQYAMTGTGPNGTKKIGFTRRPEPTKPRETFVVLLDRAAKEAFLTVDEVARHESFFANVEKVMEMLGFALTPLPPGKAKRAEARWSKHFGG